MDRAPRRRKIPMSVEENELARKQGNKKFDTSYILQPVEDGPGFIWPGLEVKSATCKFMNYSIKAAETLLADSSFRYCSNKPKTQFIW